MQGSKFQQSVCKMIAKIPKGKVTTYKPKLCNRKLKISPIIALNAHSLKICTTNKVV